MVRRSELASAKRQSRKAGACPTELNRQTLCDTQGRQAGACPTELQNSLGRPGGTGPQKKRRPKVAISALFRLKTGHKGCFESLPCPQPRRKRYPAGAGLRLK